VPPVEPEVCEFGSGLTADDPSCVPPVEPDACDFDPSLSADDPTCTPQVGNVDVTPPTTAPPSGDPGSPDGALPSEGGSSSDLVVAPGTVSRGALPRTGGENGPLVAAALILILLGVGTLIAQRASRPRGTHFAA
jgi:LPXTG-motif cell wall-anchored protein